MTDAPIGRPGEIDRLSHCGSCLEELVPAGENECAFCRECDP